jgi:hypothetical protein
MPLHWADFLSRVLDYQRNLPPHMGGIRGVLCLPKTPSDLKTHRLRSFADHGDFHNELSCCRCLRAGRRVSRLERVDGATTHEHGRSHPVLRVDSSIFRGGFAMRMKPSDETHGNLTGRGCCNVVSHHLRARSCPCESKS